MFEFVAGVLLLLVMAFIGVVIYKYRYSLKRYLNDPKYGSSWSPSRKVILKRKIEDAEAELKWLEEKPEEEEPEE